MSMLWTKIMSKIGTQMKKNSKPIAKRIMKISDIIYLHPSNVILPMWWKIGMFSSMIVKTYLDLISRLLNIWTRIPLTSFETLPFEQEHYTHTFNFIILKVFSNCDKFSIWQIWQHGGWFFALVIIRINSQFQQNTTILGL